MIKPVLLLFLSQGDVSQAYILFRTDSVYRQGLFTDCILRVKTPVFSPLNQKSPNSSVLAVKVPPSPVNTQLAR